MWCCKHATAFNQGLVPLASWRRHGVSVNVNGNQQDGKLGVSGIPKAEEKGEISGSDVIWALQRASNRKKNKKHPRDSSSVSTPTQLTAVDFTNLRPLSINANWPAKLDHLEERLRDLSHTI